MSESVLGVTRPPTLTEVSVMVKLAREARGWKQAVLAAQAGLTEKTVARVEQGVRVQEESYRRLAVAFGVAEDAFTAERYFPTPEEFSEANEERQQLLDRDFDRIEVRPLSDPRDVLTLFRCHATLVDDRAVEAEHMMQIAVFKSTLQEWGDVSGDLPETSRLEGAQHVLEATQAFAKRYAVCYACRDIVDGKGQAWTTGVVLLIDRSKDVPLPTEVWIDKRHNDPTTWNWSTL
jgi:transcriptional regulator with XRE-family HTH domain